MHVERSALVPFPARRMFGLVNDVRRYPERFAWCSGAEVLAESAEQVEARLTLKLAGLQTSFVTRNRLAPYQRIGLELVEGPFRALGGAWTFLTLDEVSCKVALTLDFEFASGLLAGALRQGFARLADRMVDDFVQCAYDHREDAVE